MTPKARELLAGPVVARLLHRTLGAKHEHLAVFVVGVEVFGPAVGEWWRRVRARKV